MAAVRQEGVAISAGENIGTLHDFQHAFEVGAMDIAQPSVIKAGGITQLLRIFTLAGVHGVKVVPHSPYWGPGYLATCHVSAAQARPPLVETSYLTLESLPYEIYNAQQPHFTLSEQPGLGFEPDWKVMEANMVARAFVG
jgi:L-alanine-DL-glutamate epimerase-like enolase superfamily enzyme